MLRRVHLAPVITYPPNRLWLLAVCVLWAACGSGDADGPVDTLSRFLSTMERSALNDAARRDAYAMLDDAAQAGLAERARRASLVTGRKFAPWEMLVPGRFRLRFAPAEHAMRATITGDQAVVHVTDDGGKERASVPMTRQGGRWRVQLAVVANARRDAAEAL